jgi:hypothetical protein
MATTTQRSIRAVFGQQQQSKRAPITQKVCSTQQQQQLCSSSRLSSLRTASRLLASHLQKRENYIIMVFQVRPAFTLHLQ